ncbi:MAG: hypothetical protein OXH50_01080 [Gemmatimonadetes bacterium]|nr:hypothetical protein [Gemmatimonadota bacterium]
MRPIDYGRSFVLGNGPENEVRMWVESRTRITDERTGASEDYIQTGSCKSEDVFVERNLFKEPNYDFMAIYGPQDAIVFRRLARAHEGYRSRVPSGDFFGGQKYRLVEGGEVVELDSGAAVCAATCAGDPLVAQTEIWNDKTGLRAVIEYPVKSMNTNRERSAYQVDTGPVAFPDLSARRKRHADGISLAFVAFNAPHFAEFVLEVPTKVGSEEIHHYSQVVRLPANNRLFSVTA